MHAKKICKVGLQTTRIAYLSGGRDSHYVSKMANSQWLNTKVCKNQLLSV